MYPAFSSSANGFETIFIFIQPSGTNHAYSTDTYDIYIFEDFNWIFFTISLTTGNFFATCFPMKTLTNAVLRRNKLLKLLKQTL